MAQKKATVYILNVGHSMSQDFSTALSTIIETIEDKVIIGRKTDMVSVLLAGTPESDNILNDQTQDQYEHVSALCGIEQPTLDLLRKLQNVCTAKETDPPADVLDAVIVAIQMIVDHCRKLKYQKRIVLFTDAKAPINWDDLDAICEMLKSNDISLLVVGSDYEAFEDAYKEDCTDDMTLNYTNWNTVVNNTPDGEVMSLARAYEDTQADFAKEVRPTPSYRGFLYLGDPVVPMQPTDGAEDTDDLQNAHSDTDNHFLAIPIYTYLRTKAVPLPTFKKYAVTENAPMDVDGGGIGDEAQKASHKVTYETKLTVEDTKLDEDGNELDTDETEITKEQVDKAFRFGKAAVKISEEELQLEKQKLYNRKQMSILRFIPKKEFPRSYLCSNATVIMPGAYSQEEANLALKALAHAMFEERVVALVRYVYTDGAPPMLGVLDAEFIAATEKTPETFILHYFETTFADDIRNYIFLRLTMQDIGQDLEEQMDRLIDSMELDAISESYLVPENVYNGLIWRVHKAIKTKALNREAPIPDLKESSKAAFRTNEKLIENAADISEEIARIAKVKEVRNKGKKRSRVTVEDEPELTAEPGKIDELLNKTSYQPGFNGNSLTGLAFGDTLTGVASASLAGPSGSGSSGAQDFQPGITKRVDRVGLDHPVEDFHALLKQPSDVDMVVPAMLQMIEAINELLRISFGNQNYKKVIGCLKALRETAAEEHEAVRYNTAVRELKRWCNLSDKFSPHREFWEMIKKDDLGLLTKKTTEDPDVANVTEAMGEEFWNEKDTKDEVQNKNVDEEIVDFDEDLDDLM